MKTSLASLSLVLAAGFPGSLLAEIVGLPLPAALDAGHTLGVFVAVLTVLTAFSDYTRRPVRALTSTPPAALTPTASGATEERRLAA